MPKRIVRYYESENMMKKFLFTTIGYVVPSMVIALPWHFIIFKDLYHSFGIYNRAEPIIPLGLFTLMIQGLILAHLYPRYYKEGSHYKEGLKFSLTMGLFLYSISTMANAAKIEVNPMLTWHIVQAGFHLLQFLVFGFVIGFVHSRDQHGT